MESLERFTERGRHVLTLSQEEAAHADHGYIGTEHLLLGLLREEEGVAARALRALGVELAAVRTTIQGVLGRQVSIDADKVIPTQRVTKVLELALAEAERAGRGAADTEHLLLGLLVEGQGIAAHVLVDLGATLGRARPELARLGGAVAE